MNDRATTYIVFVLVLITGVPTIPNLPEKSLYEPPHAPQELAWALLGTLSPPDLANAIALRDKAAVTRTPGVGPKVAERIVTELKDKAPAFANVDPAVVSLSGAIDDSRAPRPVTDAISALVNLGYGQPQAAAAIAAASRSAGEKAETAQLIRLGLKELAK